MKLASVCGLALLITACQTRSGATEGACGAFRAITYSKADTPATSQQVREHNAVGVTLCGWGR